MVKSLLAVVLALGVAVAVPPEHEEYCQADWLQSHGQKRSSESTHSPASAHRRHGGDKCNAEGLSSSVVSTGCPDEEPCASRAPDARPGGLSTDAQEEDEASQVMIGLLASVAAVFVVAGAAAFLVKRRVAARLADGGKGDGGADAPPSGASPTPGIDIDSIGNDLSFAIDVDEQVDSRTCVRLLGRTRPATQMGSEPSKRAGPNRTVQASECGANMECPGSRFGKDDGIDSVDSEFGSAVQRSRSTGSTKSDASSPRPLEVRLDILPSSNSEPC